MRTPLNGHPQPAAKRGESSAKKASWYDEFETVETSNPQLLGSYAQTMHHSRESVSLLQLALAEHLGEVVSERRDLPRPSGDQDAIDILGAHLGLVHRLDDRLHH